MELNNNIVNPFIVFLKKFNIIPAAFSLIISLNLNQLSNSFGQKILSPIINSTFQKDNIKLEERTVKIYGITLQYGHFLMNLIQFFFTLIILYFIYVFYNFISEEELTVTK
jgi:large-conductance mechanosensitive channel